MKIVNYILGVFAVVALLSCEKEEVAAVDNTGINATKSQLNTGFGGSMSQFTVMGDYLYTIDYKTLNVFYLADAENPSLVSTINMGIGMESIFPQDNYLYIGAQDGVHVYEVTDPRSPVEVSRFEHVTSCDPVIANDNYAIATLRGGMECGGNLTELDIINMSEMSSPTLAYTTELTNPYGLGFSAQDANLVYVCDGYAGLKAYDISNSGNPELVLNMEDLIAVDVLSGSDNLLVVLTKSGVYQYDASDPLNLVEKSVIPVQ